MNIIRNLQLCALFLMSYVAWAAPLQYVWDPMPGATLYEYEVSTQPGFSAPSLVRQGSTEKARIDEDLRPGVYHIRLRVIDDTGKSSQWSQPVRYTVKTDPPKIRFPRADEKIEIARSATPIFFAWSTVEGAQDYEVRLAQKGENKKVFSKIVPSPAVTIDALSSGKWDLVVQARYQGEPMATSEKRSFELIETQLPKPSFIAPQDSDILPAYEPLRLKWWRKVPGKKSVVEIYRLDPNPGMVTRETVYRTPSTWIVALAPGKYQITIRDFLGNTNTSSTESITVSTMRDPLNHYSKFLGTTLRVEGQGLWGHVAQTNPTFLNPNANAVANSPHARMHLRANGKIWSPWGYESSFALALGEWDTRGGASPSVSSSSNASKFNDFEITVGPTYRWEYFGPTKPITFKALGKFYRTYQMVPQSSLTDLGLDLIRDQVDLYVAQLAAEWRVGGWSSRYDILSELKLSFPLTASGFVLSGTPNRFMPDVGLNLRGRRKFWEEYYLVVGLELVQQNLKISGDGGVTNQQKSLRGFTLGLDWDL